MFGLLKPKCHHITNNGEYKMNTLTSTGYQYDEGLRNFMLNMFNHTALGLALSGVVAYFVYATGLVYTLMTGPLAWIVMLAPLGMIFWYASAGQNWPLAKVKNFYYAFTAIMGIGLSTLFAIYTAYSLTQVFFITSATFAGASIYGYTTKKRSNCNGQFLGNWFDWNHNCKYCQYLYGKQWTILCNQHRWSCDFYRTNRMGYTTSKRNLLFSWRR